MPDKAEFIGSRADEVSPPLVCSWAEGGRNAAWVQVAGELDIATAPQLERTLCKPELRAGLVVLDLRELAFIDSSGVHAIGNASRSARDAGGRLVVLRGPRTSIACSP